MPKTLSPVSPRRNPDLKQPKYLWLAALLRGQIESQQLKVGERLPTFTEMCNKHSVTIGTVERTYNFLEQEGIIERQRGRGVFVAHPQRELTGNIGFIGSASMQPEPVPYYAHLLSGMQQALGEHQQELLYLGTDLSWRAESSAKVDGVLICNIEDVESIVREIPADLPRVSMFRFAEDLTSVGIDDSRAALLAMRHLLDYGHRRIACLMERTPSDSHRRYTGYCEALQKAGITPDPRWARLTTTMKPTTTGHPYREWAQHHMRAWLREDWEELGCTAILVQNEVAALGVIQVFQEENLAVPQQVSVMGFDGTEICDLITPRISAVSIPLEQIGVRAMEILNRQIAGKSMEAESIMLPVTIRPGESVGPPP